MRCRKGYDLEFLANRRPINEFCPEHNHRTCCGRQDTRFLRGVFETMEQKAEFGSEKCFEDIYTVICSSCEPDMVSQYLLYFESDE